MSVFTPKSAKNCKVRIGAVALPCKKWTVTPKVEKINVGNAESAGFNVYIGGMLDADVVIEFDLDSIALVYDIANIQPGNNNTAVVKLYLNDTSGPFWNFPQFFIEQLPNVADVHQAQAGTLTGCGSGTWSYPTGSF